MGQIDAEARDVETTLKRTSHNLKHGFTWRGTLTAPFRRGAPKAPLKGQTHQDISPVFTDEYTSRTPSKSPTRPKVGRPKSAPSHASGDGTGLVGKGGKDKKEAAGTVTSPGDRSPAMPPSAGHMPEGFDGQLDILDGLLDGLNTQAHAINAELRQQNDGIEVLAGRIEPAAVETSSQAQQIKRRFRVRG